MSEFLIKVKGYINQFLFAEDDLFKFKNLNFLVQLLVYFAIVILGAFNILVLIVALSGIIAGDASIILIALVMSIFSAVIYYIVYGCGKACWGWAYNKDRNTDFAFAWGLLSGLFGTALYWIYTLFHEKNPDNWEPANT